jgi:hypothetical protein
MPKAKEDNPIAKKILKETFGSQLKSNKEDDEKPIPTSFLETNDCILEQISSAELAECAELSHGMASTGFVKFSKLTGEVEEIDEFTTEGNTYKPIVDAVFEKRGIYLPSGVTEYKDTAEIINQIDSFLKENCELPVYFERLFPYLVMFYWVYDKFPFIPYIHFVGGTGTGKTTAMDALGAISYKAIDTTGSMTIASLFRLATRWRGTLLIDEFDTIGEGMSEMLSFLKAGVSNRLLFRTEGEKEKDVKAYVVKSPKFFTSEDPISDAGLQSRTMVVRMNKSTRRIPLFKLPEYYEEAQEIRNKLLLWRLRNLNKINLKEIKYGFSELESFDRRVQQVVTPIYYFSDPAARLMITQFAIEQEEDTKRERRDSLPGRIFELAENLWATNQEVQIKALTIAINEDNIGYKDLTEKKIGAIVRTVLGFNTEKRGHDKNAWIIRNTDQEKRQIEYYGITIPTPVEAPNAPQAPQDLEQTSTNYNNQNE